MPPLSGTGALQHSQTAGGLGPDSSALQVCVCVHVSVFRRYRAVQPVLPRQEYHCHVTILNRHCLSQCLLCIMLSSYARRFLLSLCSRSVHISFPPNYPLCRKHSHFPLILLSFSLTLILFSFSPILLLSSSFLSLHSLCSLCFTPPCFSERCSLLLKGQYLWSPHKQTAVATAIKAKKSLCLAPVVHSPLCRSV